MGNSQRRASAAVERPPTANEAPPTSSAPEPLAHGGSGGDSSVAAFPLSQPPDGEIELTHLDVTVDAMVKNASSSEYGRDMTTEEDDEETEDRKENESIQGGVQSPRSLGTMAENVGSVRRRPQKLISADQHFAERSQRWYRMTEFYKWHEATNDHVVPEELLDPPRDIKPGHLKFLEEKKTWGAKVIATRDWALTYRRPWGRVEESRVFRGWGRDTEESSEDLLAEKTALQCWLERFWNWGSVQDFENAFFLTAIGGILQADINPIPFKEVGAFYIVPVLLSASVILLPTFLVESFLGQAFQASVLLALPILNRRAVGIAFCCLLVGTLRLVFILSTDALRLYHVCLAAAVNELAPAASFGEYIHGSADYFFPILVILLLFWTSAAIVIPRGASAVSRYSVFMLFGLFVTVMINASFVFTLAVTSGAAKAFWDQSRIASLRHPVWLAAFSAVSTVNPFGMATGLAIGFASYNKPNFNFFGSCVKLSVGSAALICLRIFCSSVGPAADPIFFSVYPYTAKALACTLFFQTLVSGLATAIQQGNIVFLSMLDAGFTGRRPRMVSTIMCVCGFVVTFVILVPGSVRFFGRHRIGLTLSESNQGIFGVAPALLQLVILWMVAWQGCYRWQKLTLNPKILFAFDTMMSISYLAAGAFHLISFNRASWFFPSSVFVVFMIVVAILPRLPGEPESKKETLYALVVGNTESLFNHFKEVTKFPSGGWSNTFLFIFLIVYKYITPLFIINSVGNNIRILLHTPFRPSRCFDYGMAVMTVVAYLFQRLFRFCSVPDLPHAQRFCAPAPPPIRRMNTLPSLNKLKRCFWSFSPPVAFEPVKLADVVQRAQAKNSDD